MVVFLHRLMQMTQLTSRHSLLLGICFCIYWLKPINISAQSLKLGFLFRPGITLGTDYSQAASFRDTSNYSLAKYKLQATIPLGTKVKLNLNKLDLNASQTFLTLNASQRNPGFSNSDIQNQKLITLAAGITRLQVGIRNGLWLYSANVYVTENKTSLKESPQLNALGYLAKIKLNNLKFIYFYGLAGGYNYKKPILLPIGGFTTKIGKKFRMTAILPIQANFSYKANKKASIGIGSTFSGFNSMFREGTNLVLNYREIRSYASINYKISRNWKLNFEGGLSSWRKMTFRDQNNTLYDFPIESSLYGSINFQYNFGKSLFGIKLDGVD